LSYCYEIAFCQFSTKPILDWIGLEVTDLCVYVCDMSAFAEYILMSPSDCYESFMDVMMSKIQLSKLVIEFLTNSPEASYEDLLNHLQTAAPLKGQTVSFSEDSLLRHSQWIVDQVRLWCCLVLGLSSDLSVIRGDLPGWSSCTCIGIGTVLDTSLCGFGGRVGRLCICPIWIFVIGE